MDTTHTDTAARDDWDRALDEALEAHDLYAGEFDAFDLDQAFATGENPAEFANRLAKNKAMA
jgi:hypothetical protein